MLTARGLKKSYGDATVLDGLDLDVQPGECVALIGHNGSGKTTAARLVAGHLEPTEGSIEVMGADVHGEPGASSARASVAFVADNPVFYEDLTVAEHLELVALAHGATEGLDERVTFLLETLGLAARRDFLPGQLSRGMRQKAQICCALVRPFGLLVLDEPVVGLDPGSQETLRDLLLRAKAERAGVLLTTHQMGFARGLADRAVLLEEGKVAAVGPYESMIEEGRRTDDSS